MKYALKVYPIISTSLFLLILGAQSAFPADNEVRLAELDALWAEVLRQILVELLVATI